jgi:hypothetical protein
MVLVVLGVGILLYLRKVKYAHTQRSAPLEEERHHNSFFEEEEDDDDTDDLIFLNPVATRTRSQSRAFSL